MSVWNLYQSRIDSKGGTKRNALLQREKRTLTSRLPNSLSFHEVIINDIERKVSIIDTNSLDIKYIYSLPDEDISNGSLVQWMDNYWLVIERDANSEVNTRAKIQQCNYLLKWVNPEGKICEQWCIVEDGTKYLTGEYEDRNFVVTRGDSRMALVIPRTEETIRLNRNYRFLIDDSCSADKLAYALTKPLKIGQVYNNQGVFGFVLQETQITQYDNLELGIADYYKFFDKNAENTEGDEGEDVEDENKDNDNISEEADGVLENEGNVDSSTDSNTATSETITDDINTIDIIDEANSTTLTHYNKDNRDEVWL